jgi:hypothetical protein
MTLIDRMMNAINPPYEPSRRKFGKTIAKGAGVFLTVAAFPKLLRAEGQADYKISGSVADALTDTTSSIS